MAQFIVTVAADLVVTVASRPRRQAMGIATRTAARLFDHSAEVQPPGRSTARGRLVWRGTPRHPEVRAVGLVEEDVYEIAIPAAVEVPVAAGSEGAAAAVGAAAARRLLASYARAGDVEFPVEDAVVCYPGETADPEAPLREPGPVSCDVEVLAVRRGAGANRACPRTWSGPTRGVRSDRSRGLSTEDVPPDDRSSSSAPPPPRVK